MTVLLAHQAVAKLNTVVGSAITVPTMTVDAATFQQYRVNQIRIEVYHAFNEATANTTPQSILIQTSISASGNDDWVTALPFTTFTGTPADEICTATETVGTKAIAVAATAGFAAGDLIYLRDTVATDSEWAYVENVVLNDTVDLIDGITTEHALTTTTIFGSAEKFVAILNAKGVKRFRCVYLNEGGTAADTHVKVEYVLITTD